MVHPTVPVKTLRTFPEQNSLHSETFRGNFGVENMWKILKVKFIYVLSNYNYPNNVSKGIHPPVVRACLCGRNRGTQGLVRLHLLEPTSRNNRHHM